MRCFWTILRHVATCAVLALLPGALVAGCAAPHGALPVVHARALARLVTRLGAGVRHVTLIVEPDDGVRAVTRPIRDAGRSIDLTMYLLTDKTIIHDLEYAHAYGVHVRVILEPHPYGMAGNPNLWAFNNLMAADIPVRWASSHFLLTHEKSMVVDGTTAYIMTTNFTRAAFGSNREFDVVDRDPPDVAAVRALFQADWTGRPYVPVDPDLPLSPANARPLLSALIGSAQHTLDVYTEELQDPAMERTLAAAARRGVRVRLILPAPSGPDADAPGVTLIIAAGARVYRMPQADLYIHAKAIVADGQRAFVGSQNLSSASLDGNRELGVIVADPDAIGAIEATFTSDWKG